MIFPKTTILSAAEKAVAAAEAEGRREEEAVSVPIFIIPNS
jgi:hypothetical protein